MFYDQERRHSTLGYLRVREGSTDEAGSVINLSTESGQAQEEAAIMRGPAEVDVTGPLAPWAAGYIDELRDQGYSPVSAATQLRLMAHMSRWLERRGLRPHQLTASVATEFLAQRRDAGYASSLSGRAIAPLLDHLRRLAVVPSMDPSARLSSSFANAADEMARTSSANAFMTTSLLGASACLSSNGNGREPSDGSRACLS